MDLWKKIVIYILTMPRVETGRSEMKGKVNKDIKPRSVTYKFLVSPQCWSELFYNDVQISWHSGFPKNPQPCKCPVLKHGGLKIRSRVNKQIKPKMLLFGLPVSCIKQEIILLRYAKLHFYTYQTIHASTDYHNLLSSPTWISCVHGNNRLLWRHNSWRPARVSMPSQLVNNF